MNKLKKLFTPLIVIVLASLVLTGAMIVSKGHEWFRYPVTFADYVYTTQNCGDAVSGTSTAVEYGDGYFHKTVLTIDKTITFDDVAGASASGYAKIYDFPAGSIEILGALCDLDFDGSGGGIVADADGDVALGTASCDTTSTLSGTEADIITSTTIAQLVTTTGPVNALKAAVSFHDGTTTAKDVYLNILYDDADSSADGTGDVTGTITLYWLNQGDY